MADHTFGSGHHVKGPSQPRIIAPSDMHIATMPAHFVIVYIQFERSI
jgi:hypothetical protein